MSQDDIQPEEKINLLADLENADCELNHDGDTEDTRPAVNYMMLQLQTGGYAALPICFMCQNELMNENWQWHLLICENCGASKWIHRDSFKKTYENQVNFLIRCPNCPKEH